MNHTLSPYRRMLNNLAQQIANGKAMLQKMGLYQAYAQLREHDKAPTNSDAQQRQRKAKSTAEANGLSIGFWLAKAGENEVDPRTVVTDTANLVEEVINLAPQPKAYACHRGCYFCCFEPVTVSEIEAAALARHIESMPEEEKATVVAKLESYAERVQAVGGILMRLNKVPCAFLDTQSGACTVYEIRPYMCRSLTSYDVAPCKTQDQPYLVDHIRYGAYTGAMIGAAHRHVENHMAVIKLPPEQQNSGENLAVAVLKALRGESKQA